MADYKLSASLLGHEADVRAVSFPNPNLVLTASRDCSVRLWRRDPSQASSFHGALLSRGSEYVNSLAYSPPSNEYAEGLVISGGKDTIIELKSPSHTTEDNAERLLVGHAHNVCALDVSPDGRRLISGGWDGQARVWDLKKWETVAMLGGHEEKAVWTVLAFDETTVITGCADKNIRIFDVGKTDGTSGHVEPNSIIYTSDVVRALCKVSPSHPSGADIASASNDGILRLWKLNGQQVGELHGHDSFVYSIASLPSGELVSSGEDRTVRIWRGEQCIQTITHPAISVWTVAVNPLTGDIVSGASDSIARVFSRREDAVAVQATLTEFDDSVRQSAIPQQQLGAINKEKLPGPSFLSSKSGTKEGQVQMIAEENGNITAHQWSMSQQQWVNVGTVVDAVGSTGKKVEYQGQSYDYVFDVDIEDGKPPLKLPYNLSENPYERASKFLSDNELPLSYLDNVANFIVENTKGATLGGSDSATGPDPMGMESRYKPGDVSGSRVLPQKEYLDIRAVKYDAVFNKILNTNKSMISSGRKETALNPGEEAALTSLRDALDNDKSVSSGALSLIVKIVTQWPYAERLAGLDLLRCLARYGSAAQNVDSDNGSLLDLAVAASLPTDSPPNVNAVMMGLRTIANLFNTANGRNVANSGADKAILFMETVAGLRDGAAIGMSNRNLLIALTTIAVNFAVLVSKEKVLHAEQRRRLVAIICSVLRQQMDSEVLYRGLIAVGTFLSTSRAELANMGISEIIQDVQAKNPEERISAICAECLQTLGR